MDLASILRPFVIGIVCNEYEFVKKKLTTTNSKKKSFFLNLKVIQIMCLLTLKNHIL
jgi:hypothetical protein